MWGTETNVWEKKKKDTNQIKLVIKRYVLEMVLWQKFPRMVQLLIILFCQATECDYKRVTAFQQVCFFRGCCELSKENKLSTMVDFYSTAVHKSLQLPAFKSLNLKEHLLSNSSSHKTSLAVFGGPGVNTVHLI